MDIIIISFFGNEFLNAAAEHYAALFLDLGSSCVFITSAHRINVNDVHKTFKHNIKKQETDHEHTEPVPDLLEGSILEQSV